MLTTYGQVDQYIENSLEVEQGCLLLSAVSFTPIRRLSKIHVRVPCHSQEVRYLPSQRFYQASSSQCLSQIRVAHPRQACLAQLTAG